MSQNNYLLQELGGFKFILEDDAGFVLLESTAFPKVIRGTLVGRGPGASVTSRRSGVTISKRGPGATITEV